MYLTKLDNNRITDKAFDDIKKICFSVSRDPNTEIFLWHNNSDIISVFTLKEFGPSISTKKELNFSSSTKYKNTNEEKLGLKKMIELLKNRSDIKKTYISTFNKDAVKIARVVGLDFSRIPEIESLDFNPKYEYLCNLIKDDINANQEKIVKCCNNNKAMLEVASKWVNIINKHNIQNTASFNLRENKTVF